MTTIRTRKRENPFVQIDKSVFTNKNLSWKAKGILGYLLSKPDDWITYVKDLEKQSSDGRDAVRSGLSELEETGYLKRELVRDKGKFKGYDYTVYEIPENGLTEYGKSEIGLSEIGKPDTTNNEFTNKESSNKEDILSLSSAVKEIIAYLNERAGTRYKPKSKKTQALIKARWNEEFRLEDFKAVIDIKTKEWLNDPKMCKYLRPETLFGTKFESYLNQKDVAEANAMTSRPKEFELDINAGED